MIFLSKKVTPVSRTRILKSKNIRFDYLVLNHLHTDYLSRLEWKEEQNRSTRYVLEICKSIVIEKLSFSQTETGPENKSFDLIDDGSTVCVYSPNHTMDLSTIIISKNDRFLLVTIDIGYTKKHRNKSLC